MALQEGFRLCEQAIERLQDELREARDECTKLRNKQEVSVKQYRGFIEDTIPFRTVEPKSY